MYNCVQVRLATPYGGYFAAEAHKFKLYRYLALSATVCVFIPAFAISEEIGSLDR